MGSSKPVTQTTVQNNDPWAPTQPYLTDIMNQAQSMSRAGVGNQQWTGSILAPQSGATQQGLNQTMNTANANVGSTAQPFQTALSGLSGGGLSGSFAQPLNTLAGVSSGANRINTGGAYGALGMNSLTQNDQPNSILGGIASSPGVNSSGFSDLTNRSLTQNQQPNATMAGLSGNQIGSIGTGTDFRNVAQSAGGITAADQYLRDEFMGGKANPYLQTMLDDQAAKTANRVNSSISAQGRYGSFGHGDALARSITAANAPILAQSYENDQNRKLSAVNQIDAARRAADATQLAGISGETGVQGQNIANQLSNSGLQLNASNALAGSNRSDVAGALAATSGGAGVDLQNIANQLTAANALGSSNRADTAGALSAVQGMTGVQGQNIANQTGAAGQQAGIYNQGIQNQQTWAGLSPTLNNLQYDPANRMMGVGATQDARTQAELDYQRQLFDQQQQQPWQQLANYQGAVSGLGPILQGTGTKTGTQTQEQPGFNPLTLAPLALMALSDRNEKTDIKKIGKSEVTGLDVFSYRYKGDPKNYPKVVGPMAQDIEKKYPGSTERVGGKLAVLPHAIGLLGAG